MDLRVWQIRGCAGCAGCAGCVGFGRWWCGIHVDHRRVRDRGGEAASGKRRGLAPVVPCGDGGVSGAARKNGERMTGPLGSAPTGQWTKTCWEPMRRSRERVTGPSSTVDGVERVNMEFGGYRPDQAHLCYSRGATFDHHLMVCAPIGDNLDRTRVPRFDGWDEPVSLGATRPQQVDQRLVRGRPVLQFDVGSPLPVGGRPRHCAAAGDHGVAAELEDRPSSLISVTTDIMEST